MSIPNGTRVFIKSREELLFIPDEQELIILESMLGDAGKIDFIVSEAYKDNYHLADSMFIWYYKWLSYETPAGNKPCTDL